MFSAVNQNEELCSSVVTMDDTVVEALTSFSLELVSGVQNGRINIEPSGIDVTVEDNDSRLGNALALAPTPLATPTCTINYLDFKP